MIDPSCFDGIDEKSNKNGFFWFFVFMVLSISMLSLTITGAYTLIKGDPCGKKETVVTEKTTDN